jgi:8-oxo-dGTP pyrophosphatase MutT (NUDIX family)
VKREFSAGGAVYRQTNGGIEWLLIQPKDSDRWQLPKGRIEAGESAAEAAVREVEEEGGVGVEIREKIDTFKIFFYWPSKDKLKAGEKQEKVFKTITFFLMESVSNTGIAPDPNEVDEVKWLAYEQALKQLTFETEKTVLKKAKRLVE